MGALPLLGQGDAIDNRLLNTLIGRLNRLDSANNAQVFYDFNKQHVQNSIDDKMVTVAFRRTFPIATGLGFYENKFVNIPFPITFTEPPIVTATFDDYGGASVGAYLSPFLQGVSTASLNLGAIRISNTWPALPTRASVNIIAVGPTANPSF